MDHDFLTVESFFVAVLASVDFPDNLEGKRVKESVENIEISELKTW